MLFCSHLRTHLVLHGSLAGPETSERFCLVFAFFSSRVECMHACPEPQSPLPKNAVNEE